MKKTFFVALVSLVFLQVNNLSAQLPKPSEPEFVYNVMSKSAGLVLDEHNRIQIGDAYNNVTQKMSSAGWQYIPSSENWEYQSGLFTIKLSFYGYNNCLSSIYIVTEDFFKISKQEHERIFNKFQKKFCFNEVSKNNRQVIYRNNFIKINFYFYEHIDVKWQITVY